ncbi:MAG TPA: hypothetical protein VGW78_02700 [Candidatus Babeliales bacterium]|jgi:hypothetical protein|nr:hypothetical protein [Candidatus Babeliales bacterium]
MNNKYMVLCALLLHMGLHAESEQLTPHELLIVYKAMSKANVKGLKSWRDALFSTVITTLPYSGSCAIEDIRKHPYGIVGHALLLPTFSFVANEEMEAAKIHKELEKLAKDDISNKTAIFIGGQKYLLSKDFDNIDNALDGNHYELYIMPRTTLITTFQDIVNIIKGAYKDLVAFIAIRPTPRGLTSVCTNKYLPRIIIGFKPNITKEQVETVIDAIPLSEDSSGFRPWYSDEIKDSGKLLYASFGSGDYKETPEGQAEYADMKSTSYWRYITNNVEDMAYKNEGQRLRQSIKNK